MNYKALVGITLVSTLLLGACGTNEEKDNVKNTETATTEAPKKESKEKNNLKDNTAQLDDVDVKILETEFLPNGSYEHQTADQIVVTYEVTNKSDKEISPMTGYLAVFEATQEDENSERKLNVGMTPMNEKYKYVVDNQMNNIKKDGTVKSATAYDLKDTTTPVILHATKGIGGEKLGEIEVVIKK